LLSLIPEGIRIQNRREVKRMGIVMQIDISALFSIAAGCVLLGTFIGYTAAESNEKPVKANERSR
jgi:hypothetical protein